MSKNKWSMENIAIIGILLFIAYTVSNQQGQSTQSIILLNSTLMNQQTAPTLPAEAPSCNYYNLNNEFTSYFNSLTPNGMNQLQTSCQNNGGKWTSNAAEVSCHLPNTVSLDCNAQSMIIIKTFCNYLKATYVCSDTSKYVGCVCGINPPTEPLNGQQPQQPEPETYTCGWKAYSYGDQCGGTCPSGQKCGITTANDCVCMPESQFSVGQVGTIFVSSTKWTGPMGGLDGADAKCSFLAKQAGFSGIWKALMSDSITDAKDRLPDTAFYRIDGAKIANSKADLFDGTLLMPINIDEHGTKCSTCVVWTGTNADGTKTDKNCHSWGWVDETGGAGGADATNSAWAYHANMMCSASEHLYCVRVS